ncbi:MAG: hypothetical protein HND43_10460 [Armatimonadetes bacterium]|jgi:hypothetical protein|nr:hypothetical protein [Armatimonadota bacterium]
MNAEYSTRYFPERLRRRSAELCKLAAKRLATAPNHMPTIDVLRSLQNNATEQYNRILDTLPFEQRPIRPSPILAEMVSLASHYGRFYLAGRHIYDVGPRMREILAGADYREVPASMLVLPFHTIYLHFGPQPFTIKGAPFEGAFVTIYMRRMQIVFTTAPTTGYMTGNAITHPTQYLYLPLDLTDADIDTPLGDIVQHAVAGERENLAHNASRPEQTLRDENGVVVVDRRGTASQEDLENFNLAIQSLDDAMRLVINTIIFVMAYRNNVEIHWSEGTPDTISRVADGDGRPKKVVEAKAAAVEGGYYKTHYVGDRFEYAAEGEATGEGVAPHWRRAHWRIQRFGEGLSQRKVILIKQVLVNAAKLTAGDLPPGRITTI